MKKTQFQALILSAGKGTRMKSELPKVLHKAAGRSLLNHVLSACAGAGAESGIVVTGHGRELVKQEMEAQQFLGVREAWQEKQLGTGHALQAAAAHFLKNEDLFLIVNGDGPLLRPETLRDMLAAHVMKKADLTLGVMTLEIPTGYGRVLGSKDRAARIIEEKEANAKEKKIQRVNGGVYVVSRAYLDRFLPKLKASKLTGELYLTDLIALGAKAGKKVFTYNFPQEELLGVNDQLQLAQVSKLLQRRLIEGWMREGICFLDPERVYVEADVEIGSGVVVEPNVAIFAGTRIAKNVYLEAGVILKNTRIGEGTEIKAYSHLEDAVVGANAAVGPFARLRPGADIGEDAKIGNFVELKKTKLGKGSKVSHLSYLGDATVGVDVNIGCGFITCNYDGVSKHETKIGDGAFVGSDVQAVAPLEIGANSYVASGSTITRSIPAGALAIARVKQENKEGYADRLRRKHAAAKQKDNK
jgi:bifunctional UDP-N-acetylglucosamine pyrophosphorylase/glucosamine-1-phosphate N-acetyltransferase